MKRGSRGSLRLSLFAFATLTAAIGISPRSSQADEHASQPTILYSNDVLGEIEPCGCRSNPLGGMLRKSGLIDKLKEQGNFPLLQLDAGDLLFPTLDVPEALRKQSRVQAKWLLKIMDQLGHQAVAPGERDFALGLKTFNELRKKSKIQFISANILSAKTAKPLLKPYVLYPQFGVAVLGLAGESIPWPLELKVTSAIQAAKHWVPVLRKKAKLVIALTHQGYESDLALAKAVPGIDIIIGAHSQSFIQNPVQIGQTRIYQSSYRNQYIGVLPISRPFTGQDHQLVGLDVGYEKADSPIAKMVAEFRAEIAKINTEESKAELAQASAPTASGERKFHTFPKCSECHLKQFDFWRKTKHAQALQPLLEKDLFKNKECLGCHTVGLGDPKGFDDVLRLAQTVDSQTLPPEELAGYLKSMGEAPKLDEPVKLRRADSPVALKNSLSLLSHSWAPVQCENCHQPGENHPFSGTYTKTVKDETCLKCHTPSRADQWYKDGKLIEALFKEKRALVTCPAGDLAE